MSTFNVVTLPAGTTLFHVCPAERERPGAGYPNPHSRRFSPVYDTDGEPVRIIYLADSAAGALGETVFRDVVHGSLSAINRVRLDGQGLVNFSTQAELVLADLRSVGARAVGAFADDIGGPPGAWSARHYERSQQLAQQVWEDSGAPTKAGLWHGIAWESHQNAQRTSYLLFTSRADSLQQQGVAIPLSEEPALSTVGDYAVQLRVALPSSWH